MYNIHLVVGDSHARPGVDNRRFDWLGAYILELRLEHPEASIKVIDMGDLEDMPSLSHYDIGKKCYEGRRYRADLEAAWDARARINSQIDAFNERARRNHKPRVYVEKYALGGNHFEGRLKRVVESSSMLEGVVGVKDGRHAEFGWTYVPFLEPLLLDGFTYSHYFVSGTLGKAIGGENPGLSLLRKQFVSCVSGHSHVFDVANRTDPHGITRWGFQAGCFLDPDQWEDYAGQANKMWRKGVLVLYGVNGGDLESYKWVGINELQRKYG